MTKTQSTTFSHTFSGYSVWLEPNDDDIGAVAFKNEMQILREMSGGEMSGVYEFAPHCTLLYNFNPKDLLSEAYRGFGMINEKVHRNGIIEKENFQNSCESHGAMSDEDLPPLSEEGKSVAHALLKQCKELFDMKNNHSDSKDLKTMNLESFFFFSYPKEADNNRGFGCVIPLVLVENTSVLQGLHDIVRNIFPPDERHQKDCIETNERESIPNEGKFIPHMAFAYAPEIHYEKIELHVESMKANHKNLLTKIKFGKLSVWNTNGKLQDWRLVASIDL